MIFIDIGKLKSPHPWNTILQKPTLLFDHNSNFIYKPLYNVV